MKLSPDVIMNQFHSPEYDSFFSAWSSDVQTAKNPAEAAYILYSKYNIPKSIIQAVGLASYGMIDRAEKAAANGFEIGVWGRHSKLNDHDKEILKRQLVEKIEQGYHIWPRTVIQMVCSSLYFCLFMYVGK